MNIKKTRKKKLKIKKKKIIKSAMLQFQLQILFYHQRNVNDSHKSFQRTRSKLSNERENSGSSYKSLATV